ncbi:MAG: hypothetical protein RLZZ500_1876 [Bacteroidota bacterium]|jgi:putative colanic acid biosynthesis UDP-glucose lipid carrier transferase
MRPKVGRYSGYLRPFTYAFDLGIIGAFAYLLLPSEFTSLYFFVFITFSWFLIAINTDFYEVYRFTKVVSIFNKIVKQFALFTIVCFAFSGFYSKNTASVEVLRYIVMSIICITFFKLSIFYLLRKYRTLFGGNFRRVVILGNGKTVPLLEEFFNNNPDYGYKLEHSFDLIDDKKSQIEACMKYVQEQNIDEIYCSLHELANTYVNQVIDFADNNLKVLKFLPDNNEIFTKNLRFEYYGYIPVASLRNIPLDESLNKLVKRSFDIVFSLFVIIGLLSWLTPIIGLLIRLESKGPIFFKQKRNGLNYEEFDCYKFRSMRPNELANSKQVSKNDPRITKLGAFLRKTSLDELPQFFNVLLGDMSVVGPRPHMISETERFAQNVDKFMVRHFVKPGITGLAQTHGFRGEVETDKDIIYRVKYDIFYLENWSLLLDLKIIFLTVLNAVKGEEKAY